MVEIASLVLGILAPVAARMIEKAMAGDDPRDVLRDARVADLLPAQSKTEAAMLAARKAAQS
jgi:hypothetical protein